MAHPRTCNAVEVFQKHSGTLLDAISDQVSLSWKLFQKKIITDKMLEKVQGQPEYERSSTILEAVRKAVNTKEELLLEFVSILEQTDSLAGDVAAEMRKDMSEFLTLRLYLHSCVEIIVHTQTTRVLWRGTARRVTSLSASAAPSIFTKSMTSSWSLMTSLLNKSSRLRNASSQSNSSSLMSLLPCMLWRRVKTRSQVKVKQ